VEDSRRWGIHVSKESNITRALVCVLAIAGWYLVYPPAAHKGNPDSYTALSQWNIDSSFGSAADCYAVHHSDLTALQGLAQNSRDFLQTQVGRCIAADDPRLVK
jgi:hypothetical protein